MTPFLEAAHWGRISTVELLLDLGANINATDDNGDSILHHSIWGLNHMEFVLPARRKEQKSVHLRLRLLQMLISRGTDVRILDHNGKTMLHRIIQESTPSADPNVEGTLAEALKSCPKNSSEAFKLFLSLGLDVNAQDCNGETPLHIAVYEQNVAII